MAGRFPREWMDELRTRADIVSVVSEYVQLHQKGRRYWGLCPFHHEKTASFSVDEDRQAFYCFGCKAGGSAIQFVMDIEHMEFQEAVVFLAEKFRIPLPQMQNDPDAEKKRTQRETIYRLNRLAAQFFYRTLYSPEGADALNYLHHRGLNDASIRKFGLGASPNRWDALTQYLLSEGAELSDLTAAGLTVVRNEKRFDMFRGRAIFPIINAQGEVLGFGGRALGDAQPKYLNSPDTPAFNKKYNVFAANLLRRERGLKRVILVEGYMDVVSLVCSGVKGVAATLGTALTPDQAKLLKRYAPEIWIAYDGDSAGQHAILRALDIMEPMEIPAKVLYFPNGQDPDEYIRANGAEAFEKLEPISAPVFRMQKAAEEVDLSTEEGRTKYAIACAPILKRVKQPVELENLLRKLMLQTGYSRSVLLNQVGMAADVQETEQATTHRKNNAEDILRTTAVPKNLAAQTQLLALLASGYIRKEQLTPELFTDERYRRIAGALLEGNSIPEILEQSGDEEKQILLEVMSEEVPEEELVEKTVAELLKNMRERSIAEQIRFLTEEMKTVSSEERAAYIKKISQLNAEKKKITV